ncbi:MAG: aminotransferase class IV [Bacillota bacterium]
MNNIGYYNGKMSAIEELDIPICDRICYFGDGVYDAIYSLNHKMIATDEHIARFFESLKGADIVAPCTKEYLKSLLIDMLKEVDGSSHFVYFQATRGSGVRDHSYDKNTKSNLLIFIKQSELKPLDKAIACTTTPDIRHNMCNIKTCNLLPNILALHKAQTQGAEEAIFIDGNTVTECTHSNVHILKNGSLITAPTNNKILAGVQRHHLILACRALGVPVEERHYSRDELMQADEAFITSAGALCIKISTIDSTPVGGEDPHTFGILQHHLKMEVERETGAQL